MKNSERKFNFYIVLVAILLSIIAFIGLTYVGVQLPAWILFLLPVFGLLISLLSFHSSKSQSSKKNFSTLISSLFGIKFFSYFLLALIFFIIEKTKISRVHFISALFFVYVVNTIILLKGILGYYKEQALKS